jgi:hypothetical protein
MGILVYIDANSRNIDPLGWAILAFLFGIFGVIIYLLLRED